MKLITRWTLAKEVRRKWNKQYPKPEYKSQFDDVRKALKALGPNPNPYDVDQIIGNNSWTEVGFCDECNEEVESLIEIGTDSLRRHANSESPVRICNECLLKAMQLIEP
jgi:hypothetical protein